MRIVAAFRVEAGEPWKQRGAVDPLAFNKNRVGEIRNAAFVSLQHCDERIGGSGTDFGSILIDARESAGNVR